MKADVTLKGRSAFICKDCSTQTDFYNNGQWRPRKNAEGKFDSHYEVELSSDNWLKLVCGNCGKDIFIGGQVEHGLRSYFKQACLADGYNEWDFREINLDPEMGEVDDVGLIHPSSVNLYVIRLSDGVIMPHPKKLGKNRYSIELLALKTNPLMYELDIAKVQDKECVYQPFKTSEDLLLGKPDMFAEIDSGTKPNEFIVVEWSEAEPIVWDNALGKAVSPSDIGLNVVSKEK